MKTLINSLIAWASLFHGAKWNLYFSIIYSLASSRSWSTFFTLRSRTTPSKLNRVLILLYIMLLRYVVKPAPSVPAPTFPAPNFWGRNGSALHPFRPQLYRPQYKNATISILVKIATDCNHSGPSQKCINIGHSHIHFITLEN